MVRNLKIHDYEVDSNITGRNSILIIILRLLFFASTIYHHNSLSLSYYYCLKFLGFRKFTLSNPGYFRQLTIRGGGGGGFKNPSPYLHSKKLLYQFSPYHIMHFTRCFRHIPIRIFQKFGILTILQRFQNKK